MLCRRVVAWWALGAIGVAMLACVERTPARRGHSDSSSSAPTIDGGAHRPMRRDAQSVLPTPTECASAPEDDADMDGFTILAGDCYDCSPQVNPAAYDDPTNDVDEDCSGTPALELELCDRGLALDDDSAEHAAQAIGICKRALESERSWGLISARWTVPDGDGEPVSPLQHGIMPGFGGLGARTGHSMLAISSGHARAPGQPNYTEGCDLLYRGLTPYSEVPVGLDPRSSPACGERPFAGIFDSITLELRVRVPSNARGYRFESNFFTYEFPDYICSPYNDFFVALQSPSPAGSSDGNVLFDNDGNVVSVNNSLLQVCRARTAGGRYFPCPLGPSELTGTGFSNNSECRSTSNSGAATGWLRTTAPASPGEIMTLRFAIWDTGDSSLDSLALIDSFEWLLEPPSEIRTVPVLD